MEHTLAEEERIVYDETFQGNRFIIRFPRERISYAVHTIARYEARGILTREGTRYLVKRFIDKVERLGCAD